MVPEISGSLALNLDFLRRMVVDLDEGQMVGQAGGVVNHPAWTIGHLAGSFQLMGGEFGLLPWLPEGWAATFGTGTTPVGDATAYPGKAELLGVLGDDRRRLAEVDFRFR
jgi:hypothetical protein